MERIEFQVIYEIQQKDQDVADSKVLDQQIAQAEQQLRSLQDQEFRLHNQYEKIQQKLEVENKKNESLMEDFKKNDTDLGISSGVGSFFIQLRHIEAEIERWENSKECLKSATHSLQANLSDASAHRSRLLKKIEPVREQLQNAKANEIAKQGELKSINDKLLLKTNELDDLKQGIEETKKKIQVRAQEVKALTPEELALLLAQKDFLQKEVSEKKKYLETLKIEENNTNSRFYNRKARLQKQTENSFLTSNWLHDRINLIAKIKILRKEMKNLQTRERGNVRSIERNLQQVESLNFNHDEIKLALIAEKNIYRYEKSQFMLDALKIERSYRQKLQRRSEKLDKTQTTIEDFTSKTASVIKLSDESASDETRQNLLLQELMELRKQCY